MKDKNNTKNNKWINSFGVAAIVAIIFIVFATIFGELYKPFKDSLKDIFSHHWIGKGVIAIVIFYVLGFLGYFSANDSEGVIITILKIVFWIALVGVLAISGFYLYEYFLVH